MGKPTVHDIAQAAGVSLATVDRVLNARPGVRAKTVTKVQQAVDRLGYVRDISAANLARGKSYSFVFLVPDRDSQFLSALKDAVEEAGQGLRAERSRLSVVSVPYQDPVAVGRIQRDLIEAAPDGVAVLAGETPMVRDMITHLKELAIPVVTLVTDQPNSDRDHFVGIDNRAAGRTAGELMGRFVRPGTGRIAVVVSTMQARDMVERRLGFDEILSGDFPDLTVLPSLEGRDDPDLCERILTRGFRNHSDIAGVYCAAPDCQGVVRAISALGLDRQVVVVAHELTEFSRACLRERTIDVVITQNVGHLARSAMRVLRARQDGVAIIPSQEKIRIEIVLRENLP